VTGHLKNLPPRESPDLLGELEKKLSFPFLAMVDTHGFKSDKERKESTRKARIAQLA